MLRTVGLERFRGFTSLSLNVAPATVIVGRNSSGKSTVLSAIRLACQALDLALSDDQASPRLSDGGPILVCMKEVVPDPSRLISIADWRQLFTDARVGEGVQLGVTLQFDERDPVQRIDLRFDYGRNAQLLLTLQVTSSEAMGAVAGIPKKSSARPRALREALRRVAPLAYFVPAFYGVTRVEEYRTQPLVDRLVGSGDQSHIVRNLVARLDAGALSRLNGFLERAVNARVVDRTAQQDAESRPDLVVVYQDSNGELELSTAGAGLISLVALYAMLERVRQQRVGGATGAARTAVFLLDEPEAHLHPRLQGQVGEELAKVATEFGVQLLIATHSVEMVNRLGQRPETMLVSVDRLQSSAVELRSESEVVGALEEFCDLTPFTSLSFLASRRILFHEGPTDARLLEALARVYLRSDDERLSRWRRYTLVPLEGVGNVSAASILKAVLTPKVFPKITAANPVRVAITLDRDYLREPKAPSVSTRHGHAELIETVWSRHSLESLLLDPPCLNAWLGPHLGAEVPDLLERLLAAVEVADRSQALEDAAIDHRRAFHRRVGADGKVATDDTALKLARKEVRAAPGVFQSGKDRASAILVALREGLPQATRHRLRGGLVDLVERAPVDRIVDPTIAVPKEIRELFDLLVAS